MTPPLALFSCQLVVFMIRFLTRFEPGLWKLVDSPRSGRSTSARRWGRGPIEVVVVAAIVAFALMIIMVALPRGRETARMAKCQQNLMQIGVGLQMYHQAQGYFPTVPPLPTSQGDSPIQSLFDTFVVPDLLEMRDPSRTPKPTRPPAPGSRVPGLICPSDSNAVGGVLSPFLSYRANTGTTPEGRGGPFQPGRTIDSRAIDELDGLSFTAAYAERLVGDRRDGSATSWNYARVSGPIVGSTVPETLEESWKGDAGADWAESTWRSTLYNHALSPNAPRSCITIDGRSALMGASSSHVGRVNVLMMDGSLKGVTPTISPQVWQGLGTVDSTAEKKP